MGEIDKRKLDIAITYVKRIADGYNPVNNMIAKEDAVLNDPNVIRCMFFVKEILEKVRENGGIIGEDKEKSSSKRKGRKEPFPFEILEEFRYQEDKSIAYVLAQLQEPLAGRNVKKIAPHTVAMWLKEKGYLKEEYREEVDKVTTVPTEKGRELGIYTELRSYPGNTYLAVIYGQKAQEFVVNNLEGIVKGDSVGLSET